MDYLPGQKVFIKSKKGKPGRVCNVKIENFRCSGHTAYDIVFMRGKTQLHGLFLDDDLELPAQVGIFDVLQDPSSIYFDPVDLRK